MAGQVGLGLRGVVVLGDDVKILAVYLQDGSACLDRDALYFGQQFFQFVVIHGVSLFR